MVSRFLFNNACSLESAQRNCCYVAMASRHSIIINEDLQGVLYNTGGGGGGGGMYI